MKVVVTRVESEPLCVGSRRIDEANPRTCFGCRSYREADGVLPLSHSRPKHGCELIAVCW